MGRHTRVVTLRPIVRSNEKSRMTHRAMRSDVSQALAGLVELERRARACDTPEALGWLMVNDTCQLVPYRQAAFWRADTGQIQALSGLGTPDRNAPFVVWLAGWMRGQAQSHVQQAAVSHTAGVPDARAADAASRLLSVDLQAAEDAAMWSEHLPAQCIWLPFFMNGTDGPVMGALVLWREQAWTQPERALLESLADAYAHAWRALSRRGRAGVVALRPHRRRLWWGAAALLLVLLLWPVRQSVLAPAEVVAHQPAMVRAPIQGVVDQVEVQPNEAVKAGQLLLTLDARELESQLETARQALAVAAAELRQGQQQALLDARSKAMLGVLQGKRDQAVADVTYLEQALARSRIHAVRDGIVIFDDPNDWIGRPVALGERIMMLADPQEAALDISLPVADAIALAPDAQVKFFLNIAPASPLDARLVRMGYRASPMPDGVMAYRVRAAFAPEEALPRIGLKGTAKLYGDRTILFLYLMRRPLAALRAWLGW